MGSHRMRNKLNAISVAAAVAAFAAIAHAGELLQDYSGGRLRVGLAVKQTRWMADSPVELEASATNLSAAAFRIDAFGELNALYQGKHRGAFIASCWTLAWEPAVEAEGPQPGKAPLSAEQFILLNPGQTFTKPLTWAIRGVAPGHYRVRLAYAPRVASPSFNFPEHWLRQQGIAEPVWSGLVFSEPVDIEVVSNH